jgi:thioredoxin-related protein
MRHKIVFTFILLALLFNLAANKIDWHYSIEDALSLAKQSDKNVFVFFTGSDWCSWCDKLNEEVFDHKIFKDYVNDNMIMVYLDFPQSNILTPSQKEYNNSKQQEYKIAGYPSVLILDADGEVLIQSGYREGGPAKYVRFLEESLNWVDDDSNDTYVDAAGLVWQKNLTKAIDIARKEDKSIFVNFTGSDWCVWCHRLRDEVFLKPEFKEFSLENLVLVQFDFPQSITLPAGEENYNRSMMQKFGVRGFPTLFLLDSEGRTIQKLGYEKGGAIPYTNKLRDLIKNHK